MATVKMGMTIEEAAECSGIGRNTMRKLVEWRKLPIAQTFGLYSVYFALPGAAAAGAAVRFRAVRTAADCPKPPLRSAVAPRTG